MDKKCTAEPYFCLVNDATLALDNPLRFRENHMIKITTFNDQIRGKKVQYDINRVAAKISA